MTKSSGLAPIIHGDTKVLILGSFPSEESLRRQEYYGNPRNNFWGFISNGKKFASYRQKKEFLKQQGIGLWDVVSACERAGSLDEQIRHPEFNDIRTLLSMHPAIKAVFFNGRKAQLSFRQAYRNRLFDRSLLYLPSSSSANSRLPRDYRRKLWWRSIQSFLTK